MARTNLNTADNWGCSQPPKLTIRIRFPTAMPFSEQSVNMLVVTQDNHTMSSNGSAEIRWASKCRKIVLLTQGNRNPEIFKRPDGVMVALCA